MMLGLARTLIITAASLWCLEPSFGAAESDAIAEVMDHWAHSYGEAEAGAQMMAHYHQDAVFWGTGARIPLDNSMAIEDYFNRQFSSFFDRSVQFGPAVIRVDGQTATATGLYTFAVTALSGEKLSVTHRYSFTFLNEDGTWRIFRQHSSQLP